MAVGAALASFLIPKLIDVGIPLLMSGMRGKVEKGLQDRVASNYQAIAGGRDAESPTAQAQRNLQVQSQLQQAMKNIEQGVVRGAASSGGAPSGSQVAASLAGNQAKQQALNLSQSGARKAALEKAALIRGQTAQMEQALLQPESVRKQLMQKTAEAAFLGEGDGPGAQLAGEYARAKKGKDALKALKEVSGGA